MGTRTHGSDGRWERAVVIGGGYSGLVTARVLTGCFREVVVLERDQVDGDTGVHPHAPQGNHAHAMLAKGAEVLEMLFPGLRAELLDLGAPVYDYGERMSFLQPAGYAPRHRTGVRIQSFTRDELERRLRRRVLALPGVTLLASARCEGLVTERPGVVSGVVYRTAGSEEPSRLAADLVVDASGRAGGLDRRLEALGVSVPEPRVVKAKITYTSMNFARPEQDRPDFDAAYQMTFAPGIPRGGVALAVERNRWTCSLFGFDEEAPPTDDQGYLDFARSLANPGSPSSSSTAPTRSPPTGTSTPTTGGAGTTGSRPGPNACSPSATRSACSTRCTARGSPWRRWRPTSCTACWPHAGPPARGWTA